MDTVSSKRRWRIGKKSRGDKKPNLSFRSSKQCECPKRSLSFRSTDTEPDCSNSSRFQRGGGCLKVRSQRESIEKDYVCSSSQSVSFSNLEIREYELRLGDNPSVSSGPPLTIGWNVVDSPQIGLDDYERERPPRRYRMDLRIDRMTREGMLMELGYSRGELREASAEALRISIRRRENAKLTLKERFQKLGKSKSKNAIVDEAIPVKSHRCESKKIPHDKAVQCDSTELR